jgi:hypothetical protein
MQGGDDTFAAILSAGWIFGFCALIGAAAVWAEAAIFGGSAVPTDVRRVLFDITREVNEPYLARLNGIAIGIGGLAAAVSVLAASGFWYLVLQFRTAAIAWALCLEAATMALLGQIGADLVIRSWIAPPSPAAAHLDLFSLYVPHVSLLEQIGARLGPSAFIGAIVGAVILARGSDLSVGRALAVTCGCHLLWAGACMSLSMAVFGHP